MATTSEKRTNKTYTGSQTGNISLGEQRQNKNQLRASRRRSERAARKQEAEERNNYWRSMTPQQQLKDLDRRLGAGVGAARQRARIEKQIAEQTEDSSRRKSSK